MSKYIFSSVAIALIACGSESARSEVESTEVRFKGYGGLELVGTLLLPSHSSKAPAVLLLPGSGPSDRDSNQPGIKIDVLRQVAERLAENGVATLRFDKRAVAASYMRSFPRDLPGLEKFFSWDAFVGDASRALSYLRTRPEIDPARTAVLGHSEGGMIAVAIANETKPKALILLGTPGRNLGDVIEEQIAEGYSSKSTPPDLLKKLIAETKRVHAAVRSSGKIPTDVTPELRALYPPYMSAYMRSVLAFEPAREIAKFNGRVLIVQGGKDIQVSPRRDAPRLHAASKGSELLIVPGASHCLKAVSSDADPGFTGPVVPAALDKTASWAKSRL